MPNIWENLIPQVHTTLSRQAANPEKASPNHHAHRAASALLEVILAGRAGLALDEWRPVYDANRQGWWPYRSGLLIDGNRDHSEACLLHGSATYPEVDARIDNIYAIVPDCWLPRIENLDHIVAMKLFDLWIHADSFRQHLLVEYESTLRFVYFSHGYAFSRRNADCQSIFMGWWPRQKAILALCTKGWIRIQAEAWSEKLQSISRDELHGIIDQINTEWKPEAWEASAHSWADRCQVRKAALDLRVCLAPKWDPHERVYP